MKLVFGSRGSDLALTQTQAVMNRVAQAHPDVSLELRIIKTTGDNKPDARLEEIGGLGAFTREIEQALIDCEIDAAVHSLKDLPTRQPEGLMVAAVAGRERPNDALITREGHTLEMLPQGASVGTSSLRRKAQLLATRPDLQIRELRGNVPTRMRRVAEGDLDAAILAVAGLTRLKLDKGHGVWEIPLALMLPAPGQGALALEARQDDAQIAELLAVLHDQEAAVVVQSERAVLQAFGGGCRAPLGAYAHIREGQVFLQVFAADMDTGRTERLCLDAPIGSAVELGRDAGDALRKGLRAQNTLCAPHPASLRDKRIVVTRACHQAGSFGGLLEAAGAKVFYLPLIEIVPPSDVMPPKGDEHFDWLIFTSVNAVEAFGQLLSRDARNLKGYSECRIAAVGEATAAAITDAGLHVDIVPDTHTAEALIEAMLSAEPQPSGKRALLPQSNLARPVIAEALAGRGMEVCALTVYHTVARNIPDSEAAKLTAFAPQCATFFSPSAVKAYVANGLYDRLQQQGAGPLYASIGPVTTEALQHANCVPIAEAAHQNEESLRDAIAVAFKIIAQDMSAVR